MRRASEMQALAREVGQLGSEGMRELGNELEEWEVDERFVNDRLVVRKRFVELGLEARKVFWLGEKMVERDVESGGDGVGSCIFEVGKVQAGGERRARTSQDERKAVRHELIPTLHRRLAHVLSTARRKLAGAKKSERM